MNTEDQIEPIVGMHAATIASSTDIDRERCASDIMRQIRLSNPGKLPNQNRGICIRCYGVLLRSA